MACYIIGSGYLATLLRDGCQQEGVTPVLVTDRSIESGDATWKAMAVNDFITGLQSGCITPEHIINATGPGNAAIEQCDADTWLKRQSELLQAMAPHRANAGIVLVSSGGTVYGDQGRSPTNEQAELRGATPYARYQIATEVLYRDAFESQVTILRVANPYGVHQFGKSGQGFVSTLIRNLLANQLTTIFGDGSLTRDYFFEEDLFDLIPLLLKAGVDGTFNIGSGVGYSQTDVVNAVTAVYGKRPTLAFAPGRSTDLQYSCLDTGAAAQRLGWRASASLEQGLAKMRQKLMVST